MFTFIGVIIYACLYIFVFSSAQVQPLLVAMKTKLLLFQMYLLDNDTGRITNR